MQLHDEQLIRACARLDPALRLQIGEALEQLRASMLEDLATVDADQVETHRGGVRVLKRIIHILAHAAVLERQILERGRLPLATPKT